MSGTQARLGDLQRVRVDNQELHPHCDRRQARVAGVHRTAVLRHEQLSRRRLEARAFQGHPEVGSPGGKVLKEYL